MWRLADDAAARYLRILFVDGDATISEGLRDGLRPAAEDTSFDDLRERLLGALERVAEEDDLPAAKDWRSSQWRRLASYGSVPGNRFRTPIPADA
jgi:hypothetical protein